MAAAGDGVAAVGLRLVMLAAVAQRQSGSRSFNCVFPPQPFTVSGAVDARDRRGRAGGAVASPADAGIYRYSAQSCGLLAIPLPDGGFALSGLRNMRLDA